jgi:hypothetical protein
MGADYTVGGLFVNWAVADLPMSARLNWRLTIS